MIQLIVYSLLIFLTLLAVADIVSSCLEDGGVKRRCRFMTAPYNFLKNRIKGMKTLKEDPTVVVGPTAEAKPSTVCETV